MTTVLFDLEGTLVTSIEHDKEAVHEFRSKTRQKLLELGIPASELKSVETSTIMRNTAVDYIKRRFSQKEAQRFQIELDTFLKKFELRWAQDAKIHDDTIPALQELIKLNCKLGVVTNTSEEAAKRIFSTCGLRNFFEITITREDVKKLKPDPEGIYLALENLNNKSFFFIGDLIFDSQAAKAAGGVSIIINRNTSIKIGFNADYIVTSLLEIPSIITYGT
ncbi:MAG: HAD-IA family hydrolase [Candidatus Bathyarchaeota archaeon]|jgi:HAD superfamily hydrolase (TIGR01549 family)